AFPEEPAHCRPLRHNRVGKAVRAAGRAATARWPGPAGCSRSLFPFRTAPGAGTVGDTACRASFRGGAVPMHPTASPFQHPITRRTALQAGAVGLLGLGMGEVAALRALAGPDAPPSPPARAVIYVFLSGGLSQLDSFDLK